MRTKLSLLLLPLLIVGCATPTIDTEMAHIEQMVWYEPDRALQLLNDKEETDTYHRMYHQMIAQHALNRTGANTSPDSVMPIVIDYFTTHNHPDCLAKAYYIQAAAYLYREDAPAAEKAISNATLYTEALPDSSMYAALIPYMDGLIAENQQAYDRAEAAYLRALPYADKISDKQRQACIYREAARMSRHQQDSTTLAYYEKALALANEVGDSALACDIRVQQIGWSPLRDTTKLQTQLYHLRQIHRRYDLEQEHEQNQSLRFQRQALCWGITSIVLVLLLTLILSRYKILYHKNNSRQLQQQLTAKQQMLQVRLHERISKQHTQFDWESFATEFEEAYDGLLSRTRAAYPALTDMDLQYIALCHMGFDIADICQLLDVQKRTIYNRRQSIRHRLGMSSSEEDFNQWLSSLV